MGRPSKVNPSRLQGFTVLTGSGLDEDEPGHLKDESLFCFFSGFLLRDLI